MKYITIAELSETIRKNLWKIPHDIDFIVGVPRSGMIAASMIASFLNVPLIDINSYLAGLPPYGGSRLHFFLKSHVNSNKVLVVEDTVSTGGSLARAKKRLVDSGKPYEFISLCVYLEGKSFYPPDLYLEDVRKYTNNFTDCVYYEWNLLQHYLIPECLFDIDGVLCVDPPDERDEEKYIEYIKNATPLFIPRATIGGLITYRLIKNKEITQEWLKNNGITYKELSMFKADSWEERNSMNIPPEVFKGEYYKANPKFKLFVESNDHQAQRIYEISGKPVYCVETNKIYQN